MTLFIADDNERFRQRLASILDGIPGIEVVGQAGHVQEAITAINRIMPDTIILDIHMSGGSGLDVLQAAKSVKPGPVVMMLTVGPSSEYREKSLAMGSNYFFEKSSDMKKMMTTLTQLARRQKKRSKNERCHENSSVQ
jgi:DNA-binding NarL/FixJ family response regulator